MAANCLISDLLRVGQRTYVPRFGSGGSCEPFPAGWVPYTVRSGDALCRLVVGVGTTVDRLVRVNCLADSTIFLGSMLWVPRLPPPSTYAAPPTILSLSPTGTPRSTHTPPG